jgi:hypothetical protein
MNRLACLTACLLLASGAPARSDITLLGTIRIPGDATDQSGLTELLSDGTPHNRLGAFGSAIAYTGKGNRYILLPDRGPGDGHTDYHCRFHVMEITPPPAGSRALQVKLLETILLRDEKGRAFVGSEKAFDVRDPAQTLRLDPEGVRASRAGTLYISDEYGPFIYEFSREGRRLRSLPVPAKFEVVHPKASAAEELKANLSGRVPNRGFEGLAISPDGGKLFAALQSPLIQDGGRHGTNVRILELNLKTNATREFLYQLVDVDNMLNEILAINDHEFLVIERDYRVGTKARFKKIVKIDIARASDISAIESLPKTGTPPDVQPVRKSPFIDLLNPRFGLVGRSFPEKVEGLAFGPDLPDGRHLLVVTTDNDFIVAIPTSIFAFAIDPADLPRYQPQVFAP